jgi:hypothetical protein
MLKNILAALLVSTAIGTAQAQLAGITPEGPAATTGPDMTTITFRSQLFTLVAAIGALDHCERQLGYKIVGKVDEVAYLRIAAMITSGVTPDNTMFRRRLAAAADEILDSASQRGIWTIGSIVKDADGKDSLKGTRIELDSQVCVSVEQHIRDEMKPTGLIPKAAPNEPGGA